MADRRVRLPSGRTYTTYQRAHLIDKQTSWGWHTFVELEHSDKSDHLWRCVRCHGVVSEWELSEGYWKNRIGSICPEFLLGLPSAPERATKKMPTIADIQLAAEGDLANFDASLEDLKSRQADIRDEIKAITKQRDEAQRILNALKPRTRTRKKAAPTEE